MLVKFCGGISCILVLVEPNCIVLNPRSHNGIGFTLGIIFISGLGARQNPSFMGATQYAVMFGEAGFCFEFVGEDVT